MKRKQGEKKKIADRIITKRRKKRKDQRREKSEVEGKDQFRKRGKKGRRKKK